MSGNETAYLPNMDAGQQWPFLYYHRSIISVVRKVAESLPAHASCLNIGCGHFNAYPDLAHIGPWHACDIEPSCIDVVRGRHPDVHAEVCSDLDAYPPEFFDFVICLEVVEHIADPLPWLSQIFRLAAPGAIVVVSTPNYGISLLPVVEYTFLEAVARRKGFSRFGIHPNKYTARRLRDHLGSASPADSQVEIVKRCMGMALVGVTTLPGKAASDR